jgi:hypothetical protein
MAEDTAVANSTAGFARDKHRRIRYTLLGANGEVVGDTIDSVNGLGPGEIWKFKAWAHADEALHTYRLNELKGYR